MGNDTISLMHLVAACRTDRERAELSLLLAHATLGLVATLKDSEEKNKELPLRMMFACQEACRVLVEQVMPPGADGKKPN